MSVCCSSFRWMIRFVPLSSNAPCQLNILRHDCHSPGVDCTHVGILSKTHKVGFRCLVKSQYGICFEFQVFFEVLGNLTHKSLEWQLAYQQIRGLLIPPDLPEGHGPRPISMGLLDAPRCWRTLSGGLSCKLLAGSFTTSGLAGGLLCSGHSDEEVY